MRATQRSVLHERCTRWQKELTCPARTYLVPSRPSTAHATLQRGGRKCAASRGDTSESFEFSLMDFSSSEHPFLLRSYISQYLRNILAGIRIAGWYYIPRGTVGWKHLACSRWTRLLIFAAKFTLDEIRSCRNTKYLNTKTSVESCGKDETFMSGYAHRSVTRC
jgi:hypothetical protein